MTTLGSASPRFLEHHPSDIGFHAYHDDTASWPALCLKIAAMTGGGRRLTDVSSGLQAKAIDKQASKISEELIQLPDPIDGADAKNGTETGTGEAQI